MKEGFLKVQSKDIGRCFLVDIGVPTSVYRTRLRLNWNPPYDVKDLQLLESKFQQTSLVEVTIEKDGWKVA